jgi:hypothetical protein
MTAIEEQVPLVFRRRAQQAKEGNLARFHREEKIIASIQHQNRNPDPGREVPGVHLGRYRFEGAS